MDQEFEGCFPDDEVRTELLLEALITDRSHIFAKFGWGNLKSIGKGVKINKDGSIDPKDEDKWSKLWGDLRSFYET